MFDLYYIKTLVSSLLNKRFIEEGDSCQVNELSIVYMCTCVKNYMYMYTVESRTYE